MRKWWWTGLFAVALVPQTMSFGQEGDKKPEAEKKADDDKAAEAKKKLAETLRIRQAATQEAMKEFSEVRALIAKKDLEGAEKLATETIEAKPDWAYAGSAYQMLAMANSQAGNKEKAGELAIKYVELQVKSSKRNRAALTSLPQIMRNVFPLIKDGGKVDEFATRLDAALENAVKEGADRSGALASKVRTFITIGKQDAADKVVADLDEATKKDLEAEPKVVKKIIARMEALDVAIENFAKSNVDKASALVKEKSELVAKALAEAPNELEIIESYVRGEVAAIEHVGEKTVKEAKERAAKIESFVKELKVDGESAKMRLENLAKFVKSGARGVIATRIRTELPGKPAPQLEGAIASWVNGSPLTDTDLKGKVVLLDFWAVWCGPCIATFPHLREWREKYGDKGFEIVGVTNYYQYDWNDADKKIAREEGLEPSKEEAAMVKFAEHHNLKHVFAVQNKEAKLSEAYGVTGIPQAVLVDKDGNVKLIRVGSGEKNAHDLEAAIRECLGLPAEEPAAVEKKAEEAK